MEAMRNIGVSLKKGQLIRFPDSGPEIDPTRIFEVEDDNEWNKDFGCWGSVRLVGHYPPCFTHKARIEMI